MSQGARNWPFLTCTGRPVAAAASSRSVCRARKAGICSRSQTSATGAAWRGSWMSVVTGSPVASFTRRRMASPRSSPGPRYASTLVRLALSNEALNTSGTASSAAICFSRAAIASVSSSLSITHGPAMTSNGWPRPQRRVPMVTGFSGMEKDE